MLERLASQLCAALVKHDRRGRTIGIKLRFADFSTHTRARTLEQPVNEPESVLEVVRGLLRELDPREPVRLLGVRVAGLDEEERRAQSPAATARGARKRVTPPAAGQLALSLEA